MSATFTRTNSSPNLSRIFQPIYNIVLVQRYLLPAAPMFRRRALTPYEPFLQDEESLGPPAHGYPHSHCQCRYVEATETTMPMPVFFSNLNLFSVIINTDDKTTAPSTFPALSGSYTTATAVWLPNGEQCVHTKTFFTTRKLLGDIFPTSDRKSVV